MLRRVDIDRLPQRVLASYYLLSSYCYYWEDQSPMTDDAFDRLCVRLYEEWEDFESTAKGYITRGDLNAGTCFISPDRYPSWVRGSWQRFLEDCESGFLSNYWRYYE